MSEIKVPLDRKFSLVTPSENDVFDDAVVDSLWSKSGQTTWLDLDEEYRVVVLADAGAGKTYETKNRATVAIEEGRTAFFIRIENIDRDFEDAFEVGSSELFDAWLVSSNDAWFYLDSVDEAKLDNPSLFKKALQRFAKKINNAKQRAHVVITSRPYTWRFTSDRTLVDDLLPFTPLKQESKSSEDREADKTNSETKSSVRVYRLKSLDTDDIRQFANYRSIPDIDLLIWEIQRANLLEMASRPFDLDGLLLKWRKDKQIGSRLESLKYIIETRLKEIDPDRSSLQPLNQIKARDGVQRLAAAVTLTGEAGILVPDSNHDKVGIDAEQVLAEWEPNDVRALLERGIFNDILYGSVRFRHRDIRELLTAEWLYSLLERGNSRRQIESLLFQQQYGEQVITPRLRPVLSWLILFDEPIRHQTLALQPEVAVESGDSASLPLPIRKKILNDIVNRIVADTDQRSARDNSAIVRIAQPDLSNDVLDLITKYRDSDDAIFFLGRLVWQGNMEACLDSLLPIAVDGSRSIYPRIASIRAVATVGSNEQFVSMWKAISDNSDTITRQLLIELLEEAKAESETVTLLISSIEKLPPHNTYEATDLDETIHSYLDRFLALNSVDREPILEQLCIGLNNFLDREPHHEQNECQVSKEFTWLVGPASHAAEILINDRSDVCFNNSVFNILLKTPAVRFWKNDQLNEYKGKLLELISEWVEFNDFLFWKNVDATRASLSEKEKRLTDHWRLQALEHYWKFESDSFYRVVSWVANKELEDDKLVALSLAFNLYDKAGCQDDWKLTLERSVDGNKVLESYLQKSLNPQASIADKWKQDNLEWARKQKADDLESQKNRSEWVKYLRASPEHIRSSDKISDGSWNTTQQWLFLELGGKGLCTDRARGSDWRDLIEEFGEDVALEFRDAAMKHWRLFIPALGSEGGNTTSILDLAVFAMMGLEFESLYLEEFPENLTSLEVTHALRYLAWEINGFPSWFEAMYRSYPNQVIQSVWKELHWELASKQSDLSVPHILNDILTYAPWIHFGLKNHLQRWVESNENISDEIMRCCLQIIANGELTYDWFSELVKLKIKSNESKALWYAVWVDIQPEKGVVATREWLSNMSTELATKAAQVFLVKLMSGASYNGCGTSFQNYKTATHLKELCVLMHVYIKIEDDNDRAGKGVYSPNLRDDAQDARNRLFNLLTEIQGKETYISLKELSRSHPVKNHRAWIEKEAKKRAELDSDLEPWTPTQVYEFSAKLEREPASHRQLYDLGVLRLLDFKVWLEDGNRSLYKTYQKISDEAEMRQVVENWLEDNARGKYMCSQETPFANDQRPDILFMHPKILSPVPVELKLLDKSWSGPKLCERLRNQLAGDYLREETAGCGIFLLIWQGSIDGRHWEINDERVGISELQRALSCYWESVSNQFPNVLSIEIVVVDLTLRQGKSET